MSWLVIAALLLGTAVLVAVIAIRPRRDPEGWSAGIHPYAPLATLKPVANDIWWVDGPVMKMTFGPLALPFPTRMVVVRLRSGGLWLWSPTLPTPALFDELDALGPVEHLVSPNRFHYAGIPTWKQRYPQAIAWASPGVRDRARALRIDVAWGGDLSGDAPAAWHDDLEQLVFAGSRFFQEVVFFHRASATLIVTDLVMALERERVAPRLRWLFVLIGATWPGQTPREVRPTFWGHKAEARACLEQMLAWQPRRILLAHGRCHLEDATAQLARALGWLG